MKTLLFLSIIFMSFLGKAQDNYMTPWDTVIVADNETINFMFILFLTVLTVIL
jgi:hypothetical protein